MNEAFAERRVTLVNPQGLHMRPADMFVRVANRFAAQIQVAKDDESVDGKSILQILTLAASQGTELVIEATGPDAQAAAAALVALVESGFNDVQDGTQLAGEH